ncbi:MAG: DUF1800 family protein, partial [Casimicrobium sp.]
MRLNVLTVLASVALVLCSNASNAQVTNCPFNVDGSGTVADALRDGVILSRYARGERNVANLVAGTGVAANASIVNTIQSNIDRLDVNGNGAFDPVDASTVLRILFNYNTDTAATIAAGDFATRDSKAAMKAYLDGGCASTNLADLQRASKFLVQATFGPRMADINAFNALTEDTTITGSKHKRKVSRWINNQFALPANANRHYGYAISYRDSICPPATCNEFYSGVVRYSFWKEALTSQDQLRQRLAFALSQIMVVSDRGGSNNPYELTAYLDMLNDNALGNFRDILSGVTRSVAMGNYLNHLRNDGNSTTPNENFAREMLQLFSVGLVMLNQDGTNQAGNPPTYTEEVVKGFARSFTGLSFDDRPRVNRCAGDTEPIPNWGWWPDAECYPNPTPVIADRAGWFRPMFAYPGRHSAASRKLLHYTANSTDPRCSAANVVYEINTVPQTPTGDGTRVTTATADDMINKAVNNIFCHPNVGPFIGKQLIRFFVTSTPSPAYVARVSAAFNNNGSNVRGDMKAVIRAVLLDDEALEGGNLTASERPKYGKLREPVLRLSHLLRAFPRPTSGAPSFRGIYYIDGLDSVEYGINQGPFQSPSVFNFYHPEFAPPGPVQRANGKAPEFEITTT